MIVPGLRAPFPWFGSKRHVAAQVDEAIGEVEVYVEPFGGSLACLLHRLPSPREIITDTDAALCNYFRAARQDPHGVVRWAIYPTIHQDLSAWHRWLIDWRVREGEKMSLDPSYFNTKAAGWWLWGINRWIGSGWSQVEAKDRDKIPYINPRPGGRAAVEMGQAEMRILLDQLADRLQGVLVLNRDWESAVSPTALMHTASSPKPPVGIFIDPPYFTSKREEGLYSSDYRGAADVVAVESWEWAIKHGETYRIAYCALAGDFMLPAGWQSSPARQMVGTTREDRYPEVVMYSPACSGATAAIARTHAKRGSTKKVHRSVWSQMGMDV